MAKITLSKNLKLKISSDFDALSKYNLERIDTLAGTMLPQASGSVVIRAESNLTLEPNSSDLGGSGIGGTVSLGTADHPLGSFEIYSDSVSFESTIKIKDTAAGGTKSLNLAYKSDLSGSADILADRTLNLDLNGSDRNLVLGTNLSLLGSGNLSLTAAGNIDWTLPSGNGASGQVLTTDGLGILTWESATAASLDGLTDVIITSPANNQIIRYDSGIAKWINTSGASGSVGTWSNSHGTTRVFTHNLGTKNITVTLYDENYQLIEVDSIESTTNSYITLVSCLAPPADWTILVSPIA